MKKKLFVMMMILVLCFTMFACGSDEGEQDVTQNPGVEDDVNVEGGDEEDVPEVIIPDGFVNEDEAVYEQDGDEYDLGVKTVKDYGMDPTLEPMDYSDLSKVGDTLYSRLTACLAPSGLSTDYEVLFNEYEVYEGDVMDELAYVAAMEENDMDLSIIEMGVYHNSDNDKHYQYNAYTSETLFDKNADLAGILADIEKAYGIKISESKAEKAFKMAWEEAQEIEDFYGVYQVVTQKGTGYTDTVTVRVDIMFDEESNTSGYLYAERERLYN